METLVLKGVDSMQEKKKYKKKNRILIIIKGILNPNFGLNVNTIH